MFGVKKQLDPVIADAQDTLAYVRQQVNLLVAVGVTILVVSVLTFAAVMLVEHRTPETSNG